MDIDGMRLGVVRGISYGLFGKPDRFGPQAHALGARLIRAYVYWAQIEPEPGKFTFEPVDALLAQLDPQDEVWITVCSSSLWGTRQHTNFQPPSPALSNETYGSFVRALVEHCGGRVGFWQCNNEPSNTGLLWAGTAQEYVLQLNAFHAAVKSADPGARVVLGGCGYDVFSSPEGSEQRQFFDYLAEAGRDSFDLFSVHLYGDPYLVPDYAATAREMMRRHGYEKPLVAGEHSGPVLFEFAQSQGVLEQVFAEAFSAAPEAAQSTQALAAQARQETPERRAMRSLYQRMENLPPQLQMFMDGCPPELEAKRHRINSRQLVTRTVLALHSGINRLAYWNLAPEIPGYHDPYQMMALLFGKLVLLDYADTRLTVRHPAADAFARLAAELDGATTVERVEAQPATIHAFRFQRSGRDPLWIVWDQRDWFDGESEPAVSTQIAGLGPVTVAADPFFG